MRTQINEILNLKMNELNLCDKTELYECPICYEENIIDKVMVDCGHGSCFNCFKCYFFHSLNRNEHELRCFMCRTVIKEIKTSKENIFLLDCIIGEKKNEILENSIILNHQMNEFIFINRRNLALRYLIPMLFLYFFYNVFYDNK